MSNSYYNHGSYPTTGAPGASSALRAELDLITTGFALLPTLSGNANKALVINAGGSAVTVTTGTLALAGNFATTGAFNTTLVQGATTSLTLPVVSGTLATLAGTETLSNKTLVAPALGTPASGIMTNVTGTAAGLTAGNVTTNANLTGDVTSVGNATSIAAGVIVNADINASAAIDDTKLATIATALKVSNSATTAASANTASAIVARDASGDFTAGTVTAALTGNSSTATALATGRTIAITGDLAYTSPSFDGTGNVTAAGTLATVATAGTTGSSTAIPVITINVKGLTTSITTAVVVAPAGTLTGSTLASGVTASSLTSLGTIASLVVTAGTISTTPSAATDIANKSYVDTIAQGLDTKASVVAGTTANITLSGAQTIDGISIVATDRVLVKNQTAPAENGIYVASATAWARASDMSTWAQVPGAYVFIETGTTLADTGWVCTSDAGGTLNTTAITWAQFSGAGSGVSSITFGSTGLTPSTTTTGAVTVAGTLAVANGGTGLTSFTSGGVVYASSSSALATGTALTFDGTTFGVNAAFGTSTAAVTLKNSTAANISNIVEQQYFAANTFGGVEQIAAIRATNPNAGGNNGGFISVRVSANGTATTPSEILGVSSTGLAVTGTLSASSTATITAAGGTFATSNLILKDNVGSPAGYVLANAGATYIGTTSTATSYIAVTSTGLAVTGTLSATGAGSIQGLTVGLGSGGVGSNTAVGVTALSANASGAANTALGYQALKINTASDNTSIGAYTLQLNVGGSSNVAVGALAMITNVSGSYNVAVGAGINGSLQGALGLNSSGSNNTAIGYAALRGNDTASNNTAVGYQAGYTLSAVANQTFLGYQAGYSRSTGADNYSTVMVGNLAGYSTDTGIDNTYVGGYAARYQTGSTNTALGGGAFYGASGTSTGSNNTAIGYTALFSNTTASNNTAVGYKAGYTNVIGQSNVFVGESAGYNSTASGNTFVGQDAGFSVTSGANNTILGGYNGNQGGLDIRTANSYIVLSDGDGNPRAYWNGADATFSGTLSTSGNIFSGAVGSTQRNITLATTGGSVVIVSHSTGDVSGDLYAAFNYSGTQIGSITQSGTTAVLYNVTSDYRLKTVLGPVADAGARIDALQPIEYEWKADGLRTRGFLAHQFQEVYAGSVSGTKDAVDADGKPKYQAMQASTSEVIADLVAELQSLRARVAQLESKP